MNTLAKRPVPEIIDAVAEAEGVEPAALDPPLAQVLDPDALETLVEDTTASELEIRFTYRDHEVVVDGSGRVRIS
ncbi:HalOD1 output domain-containing protein [Natronoarchaeum rubrum]|uniref:HalOD1 output domain-containing protein n=1 Tax=Natronoarchaeum rubrum TaxID=755311 RepID=UPI00211291DF|nr:HalOD1 output domain-containing protein [Natronoarchaeum rubrum]HMB49198.1 HalOD1 output domain-containing protein [Natronoarchaeum rubrum]